jgi:deoxyribose-phosphate aldolase
VDAKECESRGHGSFLEKPQYFMHSQINQVIKILKVKVKVKLILEQATMAQKESGRIALLFL